jgi:tRNA pseudouridine65 synthase
VSALPVLYEDDAVIVVDKPSGLAVHRGWAPERDVVVARLAATLGAAVHPVHRLDRGTSGALLLARTPAAARALGEAFAAGLVDKRYLALVRGVPPEEGIVDHPVPTSDEKGAPRAEARTAFRRLEVLGRYSLVEARPLTGRLHQIRRHMKHLSCPLVGDVNYGKGEHNRLFRARFGLHRIFLHARSLTFPHPSTGAATTAEAPLPTPLAATLEALRAGALAPP